MLVCKSTVYLSLLETWCSSHFKWCSLFFFWFLPFSIPLKKKNENAFILNMQSTKVIWPFFLSSWGSNMIRLRNVSAFPLNLLPSPIQSPSLHHRVPFIQRKRARPKQAHLQHSARAVGHLKGEEGWKRVCLWKRKRGGGMSPFKMANNAS